MRSWWSFSSDAQMYAFRTQRCCICKRNKWVGEGEAIQVRVQYFRLKNVASTLVALFGRPKLLHFLFQEERISGPSRRCCCNAGTTGPTPTTTTTLTSSKTTSSIYLSWFTLENILSLIANNLKELLHLLQQQRLRRDFVIFWSVLVKQF